jgi:adenosylcobinamide kinase / adenosylcobinamide-phosphate guanylyltransferase
MNRSRIILVLGGARSGKSAFAEQLIDQTLLHKIYIATCEPFDGDMNTRISLHKSRRGANWTLVEEPIDLMRSLTENAHQTRAILVDCLTLWLTNLMMGDKDIAHYTRELTGCLQAVQGTIILVSNEVGQGIVPDNKMARDFRDYAGVLHQKIAAIADEVYFITAGLPHTLKG